MDRFIAAVFFLLTALAGSVGAGQPVVVIDEVTIASDVGHGRYLLTDGRVLDVARPSAWGNELSGRRVRVIATVDPVIGDGMLTGATVLLGGKSDDEIDVMGGVTFVDDDRFGLSTPVGEFEVQTDASTEFRDLTGVSDLRVGDVVRVKGTVEGAVILAEEVRWLGTDDGGHGDDDPLGIEFTSVGQVLNLGAGTTMDLDDGRTYQISPSTGYSGGLTGYADLNAGMVVEVEAVRDEDGVNWALEIELEDDGDGVVETTGLVDTVDPTGFTLQDGPRFEVVASTEFDGDADRLDDLEPGWTVSVDAYDVAGVLTALEVGADDPAVASTTGEDYEPHEALVILAAGADPAVVASRHGAVILGEIGDIAVLFRWDDDIDDELLITLESDPDIDAVEPNYLFRDPESVRRRYVVVDHTPSPSEYTHQDGAVLARLRSARFLADGSGTVVAIIDTGVDPDHPALMNRVLPGGLDLIDGDDQPWETRNLIDDDGDGDLDEAAGHGTFVASLVLLAAPGTGILPYRVLDDDGGGSAYLLSLALADAIDRQVDVINLSLVYQRRSAAVDRLLEQAGAAGIAVIAAAGNDGLDVLPFPASDRHTVAVTALNADGSGLAEFANRGPDVLVAAPGVEVYGAVDDGRWGTWSGTSMAVPFTAGAMAVLRQIDPGLDPVLFADLLRQSGRPLTDGVWNGVALDVGRAVFRLVPQTEAPIPSPPAR